MRPRRPGPVRPPGRRRPAARRSSRAAAAEDVHLDLLEVEQIDEPVERLTHGASSFQAHAIEETRPLPPAAPPGRAGRRPGQAQMLARPRHRHIEQPPLLLDRSAVRACMIGSSPSTSPTQEHRVPLEALGRVQGGEGDALDGGRVLGGGPLRPARPTKSASVASRPAAHVLGELRRARPATPSSRGPRRRRAGRRRPRDQADAGQHVAGPRRAASRRRRLGAPGGAAQQHDAPGGPRAARRTARRRGARRAGRPRPAPARTPRTAALTRNSTAISLAGTPGRR